MVLKPYGRTYVACLRCGLVFRSPMPSGEIVQEFYRESASSNVEVEVQRADPYKGFLEKLETLKPRHGKLLDIGCGYGNFVRMARGYGWDPYGIELSREACGYIREMYGLPVYSQDLRDVRFPSAYFDVVTMWNVLDHLADPLGHLREVRRVIKADGVLFVRVPNFPFQCTTYRIGRMIEECVHAEVARRISVFHLYCFTRDSLEKILNKAGFNRVKVSNGRPSRGDPYRAFSPGFGWMVQVGKYLIHFTAQLLFYATGGAEVFGSSIEAYAEAQHPAPLRCSGKVKILHLITRLDRGGSAENTVLTVSGLQRKGYDVTLVSGQTLEPTLKLAELGWQRGKDWTEIPELVRQISPVKDIKALFKIYALIKRGCFQIVHTHSSKAGILGRVAAKLASVPILVHTPHGHVFYGYYGPVLSHLFLLLERIWAKFTDRIVTLTEKGKQEHIQLKVATPEKFTIVPSGVQLENFLNVQEPSSALRQELGISSRDRIVGSVGRFVPIKGYRYFLEAAKEVLGQQSDVLFLLVGDGPLEKELKAFAEALGIAPRVVFAGYREDVAEMIALMDIFVLPSLNEGMGKVLVEAMAEGKPVVATKVGGVPELVSDNLTGILCPPKDSCAMAEAILKLLRDRELARRMGEEGRRRVYPRFDAKVMVEKIEGLYRELMRQKVAQRPIRDVPE